MKTHQTGRRRTARALIIALLVVLAQAFFAVAAPSYACACGAMEPTTNAGSMQISGETALITHDGTNESIYLSFDVAQSSTQQAALILPLPRQAKLELGPKTLFTELFEVTKPRVEKVIRERSTEGGGKVGAVPDAAPSGVYVLSRQDLGPFTAVQITSKDANELATWLTDHNFRTRPEVIRKSQPYLDEGWVIAVIQLKADGSAGATTNTSSAAALTGQLQPIKATFASETIVYPMRLQALAAERAEMRFYVLAEHKMQTASPGLVVKTVFAGPLSSIDSTSPSLKTLRPATATGDAAAYLTRLDGWIDPNPGITDLTFTPAANDEPYRAVTYEVTYVDAPLAQQIAQVAVQPRQPAFWLIWGVLGVLALGIGLVVARLRRRQRS